MYQDFCNNQAPMPGVKVPDLPDHTAQALYAAEHGDPGLMITEFHKQMRDVLVTAGLAQKSECVLMFVMLPLCGVEARESGDRTQAILCRLQGKGI